MVYPSRAELKEKAERVLAWVETGEAMTEAVSNDICALCEATKRREGPPLGRSVAEGLAVPGYGGLNEPKDEVLIVPATVL